jgi:putative nucleotidyltransferase with HDIG domain
MSHLVDEARSVAQTHLEVTRPARWQHVTAVAAAAERLAALLDAPSSETVVTAAWLHDIGHAPGVRDTGFHALDGARFLTRMRRFPAEVIALVAHHSGADSEAAQHGPRDRAGGRSVGWPCDDAPCRNWLLRQPA